MGHHRHFRNQKKRRAMYSTRNVLYYRGVTEEDENNIGGVGFIINKTITSNVTKYTALSNRVAYIKLNVSNHCDIKIIQVCAPTTSYEDEIVEHFYEEITTAIQTDPCQYTLVIGDFNAKLGKKEEDSENRIGNFGLGERNDRGRQLMNFLEQQKMYAMNTFYQKKANRKWTWISPNKESKNEIDFILSSNKSIINDVSVLNSIGVGSDHRIVRAKIQINVKWERAKRMKLTRPKIDANTLRDLKEVYEKELKHKIDEVSDLQNKSIDEINTAINDAMLSTAEKVAKTKKQNKKIWSTKTKALFEKRRLLLSKNKHGSVEYVETNKVLRKSIREDKRKEMETMIDEAIEKGRNMKSLKRALGRTQINALETEQGIVIKDHEEILRTVEKFFEDLYEQKQKTPKAVLETRSKKITNVGSEDILDITEEEIMVNIRRMKYNKAAGSDNIIPELIKEGGETIVRALKILFNKCLVEREIPQDWNKSLTILLHKKGDKKKLKNYRPISLLPQAYKLLTKIIITRMENKLEQYQTIEQAGFRKNFSTSDHILTLRTLIEKCTEYNLPLYLAFVDYEKAFDSIEMWSVEQALQNSRIDHRYTELILKIYEHATMEVQLQIHGRTKTIPIRRGVRQGDTMSPKLFIAAIQHMFQNINWDDKGIIINGKRLHHLKYADDIVIIANSLEELQTMLNELKLRSEEIGLKLNKEKTKILTNQEDSRDIIIDNQTIEHVHEYVYLGQTIRCGKSSQAAEINRRIRSAWCAFGIQSKILKDQRIPLRLRKLVFNQCVLPALTYAAQTWTLTNKLMDKISKVQRAMERIMLNIKLIDKITNESIRQKTKVIDVKEQVASMKWRWAGHTLRQRDGRWNQEIQYWRPWMGRRDRGRPQTRWRDDLRRVAGVNWMRESQDRELWKEKREAYVQHWTKTGLG